MRWLLLQRRRRDGSLTDRLYEQLRQAILSGELAPGAALFEGALAEQFNVSKTPVREALARLRLENLVRVIPYKGYYVAPVSLHDVQSLYQVRVILETGAVELAVRMATPSDVENLMAIAKTVASGIPEFFLANKAFHQAIAGITRNDRLQKLIVDCIETLQRVLCMDTRVTDPMVQVNEHVAIVESIAARDAARARRLVAEHIERSQRRVLEQILSAPSLARE